MFTGEVHVRRRQGPAQQQAAVIKEMACFGVIVREIFTLFFRKRWMNVGGNGSGSMLFMSVQECVPALRQSVNNSWVMFEPLTSPPRRRLADKTTIT